MAKDQNTNAQQNHDEEEIYGNIGKYESMSTEIVPTAVTPQREISEPSEKEKKQKRKLTKKEKKELRREQAQLEKKLVKEGKIAPRYRYVPRNNFARILSVCLAFVFGFFAAFGALIGGFAIFGAKKKIKDVTEIAGINSSAIFTDYAASLSALDFVVEIVQKIKDGNFKTLGNIAEYTPLAEQLADQVVSQLAEAEIEVDKDELMATPLSELGKWFQDNVTGAYTDDYINTHTLGDVLDIDENSAVILQTLKDTLICDLGEKTQALTLSEMLGEYDIAGNKIFRNLGDSTLDTLSADVQKLTVEQIFGDEMYSYLSVGECGGSYAQIVADYEENRKTAEGSEKVPYPVELGEGDEIVAETEGGAVKYYLYRNGEKADELDRYLDGVWYLLFGEEGKTDTPVLEINAQIVKAVDSMNGYPLYKLWLHGLIEQNPYKELPLSFDGKDNLNEFTITGLIKYVQQELL